MIRHLRYLFLSSLFHVLGGGGLIESYYFIFLGEISELMINNSAVRKMYSNLVPGEVSHKHFWARYFYKVQRFFIVNEMF